MLQGTLDVFSLDEVLGLLAGANKSGVLNISGDRGIGSISINDGQLVAGSASCAPDVTELSEAVFELLRFDEGSFSFDGDAVAEGDPSDVETVLTSAHARLGEWREIEAVVPTLHHHLALAETITTSEVTLNEAEWAAIVAIGEGATVGVVADRLGLGEFDGSKRVKGLIERDLVAIEAGAPVVETPAFEAPVVEAPVVEAPVVEAPVFETPVPAPASFDVAETTAPDTVVADHPTFDSAPVAPAADHNDAPPMPEAPAASFETVESDDIPPMPEPPRHFGDEAAIAEEFAAPIEADSVEAIPAPEGEVPRSFAGLDPIGSVDMFEPPQRVPNGSADGFAITENVPSVPATPEVMDSSEITAVAAPEASDGLPSFAPPAFDPEDFAGDESPSTEGDPFAPLEGALDAPVDSSDATEDPEPETHEKGSSLLMRYLKSNG